MRSTHTALHARSALALWRVGGLVCETHRAGEVGGLPQAMSVPKLKIPASLVFSRGADGDILNSFLNLPVFSEYIGPFHPSEMTNSLLNILL